MTLMMMMMTMMRMMMLRFYVTVPHFYAAGEAFWTLIFCLKDF